MNKYYHCTEICVHLKDDFHVISMIAQMTDEEVQTLQYLEVFMKTTL